MVRSSSYLKCIVAALAASVLTAGAAPAQEVDELDALFEGLKSAEGSAANQIESRIYALWSQSGSASMDVLLERGRDALEDGDVDLAIEHFSALIDHAPDFAEGYNARATAYFQKGMFGMSLDDIRRTLELNPRHFGAMSGLALILEEIGYPEDALTAWRQVQAVHPNREGLDDAIRRLERQTGGEDI